MTVYVTNHRNVAHLWAAQTQSRAKGHNLFFEGPVIYSYGYHFPIAVFTPFHVNGERVVVFNGASRSVSTSKHQSYTRGALHGHAVHLGRLVACAVRPRHLSRAVLRSLVPGGPRSPWTI